MHLFDIVAHWFAKLLNAYLAVVALTIISKVASSRYWWMIVNAC